MMQAALYVAVAISLAAAKPEGFYHQEYNYKTSSSSFKNNELQHKTDDQGYYRKDGDLEGKVRPKVSANSEHSEYVNPNSQNYGSGTGLYGSDTEMSSHGNMMANSFGGLSDDHSSQYARGAESEGIASTNHISGVGQSSTGYQGSYSSSIESSNLRSIASRLQNDLQQELQSMLNEGHRYDIDTLEQELKQNLTSRLQQILQDRYGYQTVRGGQSYSLNAGRIEARPNYNQQDLETLQRQVENSLLGALQREYHRTQSSHQTVSQHNYESYTTTTSRPYITTLQYRPIYPSLDVSAPEPQTYPRYGPSNTYNQNQHYSQNNRYEQSGAVQYTQVPQAISVSTIATNVQTSLNEQLNRILEDVQRQYFTENSRYNTFNSDSVLDRLKQEVRSNLSQALDQEVRRHFGSQLERNGYMFTVGGSGQIGNQYNYNLADLENLRRQVENNLINKLTRDFQAAHQHWITTQQHASSQSQQRYSSGTSQSRQWNQQGVNTNQLQYNTPAYQSLSDYNRPTSPSIIPLITSGVKGGYQHQQQGGYQHQQQGVAMGSYGSSSTNVANLQRQLQTELSSQLQAALSQNRVHSDRYASGGSFDEAYNRLYDELQRNLTQQMQSFTSGSFGNSFGQVSENQLAQLRSQLQNSLASQLQQGLQQSYSASASFSASSSGSASTGGSGYHTNNNGEYYRAARGSDLMQLGQYGGYLVESQNCQPGETSYDHQYHRSKRSYVGYRSQPLGLSSHAGVGYNSRGSSGYGGSSYGGTNYGGYRQMGQEVDDSELIGQQQVSTNLNQVGQEIDDTDDTQQQVEFGADLNTGSWLGQEVDDSDTTALGSQHQASLTSGSQLAPIHPQSNPISYTPAPSTYGSHNIAQIEDDSDNTQQIQEPGINYVDIGSQSSLSSGSQLAENQYSNNEQVNKPTYGKQFGQVLDADDTYRVNKSQFSPGSFGNQGSLSAGSQLTENQFSNAQGNYGTKPVYESQIGQEENNFDDTQQVVEPQFDDFVQGQSLLPSKNQLAENQRGTTQRNYRNKPTYSLYGNQFVQEDNSPVQPEPSGTVSGSRTFSSNRQNRNDLTGNTQAVPKYPLSTTTIANYKPFLTYTYPLYRPYASSEHIEPTSSQYDSGYRHQSMYHRSQNQYNSGYPRTSIGYERNPQYKPTTQGTLQNTEIVDNSPKSQVDSFDNTKPIVGAVGDNVDKRDDLAVSEPSQVEQLNSQTNVGQQVDDSDVFLGNAYNSIDLQSGSHLGQEADDFDTLQHPESNQWNTSERPESNNDHLNYQPQGKPLNTFGAFSSNNSPLTTPTIDLSSSPNTGTGFNVQVANIPTGVPSVQPTGSAASPVIPSGYDFGYVDPNRPVEQPTNQLVSSTLRPYNHLSLTSPTTSKNPYLLQFGTQNFVPTAESVQPLGSNFVQQPIANPVQSVSNQATTLQISTELQQVSVEIQENLLINIEKLVAVSGPISLYSLRESIKQECEKLLTDRKYAYLNIQPSDLVKMEQYIEQQLTLKLQDKISQTTNPLFQRPIYSSYGNRGYVNTKPQVASTNFMNTEINSYDNQPYQPNLQSASQVTPAAVPALPTPAPFYPNSKLDFEIAQQTSKDLVQSLTNHINKNNPLVNLKDSENEVNNYKPNEYKVIEVKLDNLTPKQYDFIVDVEEKFSIIVTNAVKYQLSETSFDHNSKYLIYRQKLHTLEEEVKKNVTCFFEAQPSFTLEFPDLEWFSSTVYQMFEFHKVPDVQKYLEIRLIKKLRSLLKQAFGIEPSEVGEVHQVRQHPTIIPTSASQRRVVKLENLTPHQVEIIKRIEDDINKQVEQTLKKRISTLKQTEASEFVFKESLSTLRLELENAITEAVQKLCEPGLSPYPELGESNFDKSKINDLEQYLQIKCQNKLKQNIEYYSKVDFVSDSSVTKVQGSVKGGKSAYGQYAGSSDDPQVPQVTAEGTSNVEEATTPAPSWWKHLKNKASQIKKKIVGE